MFAKSILDTLIVEGSGSGARKESGMGTGREEYDVRTMPENGGIFGVFRSFVEFDDAASEETSPRIFCRMADIVNSKLSCACLISLLG